MERRDLVEDYSEQPIKMLKRHCSMFMYGSEGSPEFLTNEIAKEFFHFALLHLISTMFINKDSNEEKHGGIFHRILDPINKSHLLTEIDKIFETSIGKTTFKEFIKYRRNRLATHRSLSLNDLPEENLNVSFDRTAINEYYSIFPKLISEVSKLYDELLKLE